jgi:integrase
LLKISVYNRQHQTSASGKEYIGYALAFAPGQRGSVPAVAEVPPFYVRDQRGGKQGIRLEARTLAEAKVEAEKQQHVLQAIASGVDVVAADEGHLASKVAAYLEEVEANKSKATWLAYNRTLELFLQSCRRANVASVTREDLLAFKTFLKKQDLSGRSVYNHFLNVCVFMKWAGHRSGVRKNDWPAKPEREPEAYTEEEIDAMLQAAAGTFRGHKRRKGEAKDDRLLLNAFLLSGLRDGELQHLSYDDIDVKNSLWTVRPKNGHNLKTAQSQRVVPVSEWLTKKIMERKESDNRQGSDLVFPSVQGGPDGHLIRVTQRIAKLAGVTGRVDNHKFRSTARLTVPDVMSFVGHVSPKTILRVCCEGQFAAARSAGESDAALR